MPKTSIAYYKKIIHIAVPVILANALLPLQGLIDTAIAGRLSDSAAIAGLGLGTGLFALIYNPCNFLQYATSGLSAQSQREPLRLMLIGCRALLVALLLSTLLIVLKSVIIDFACGYYQGSPAAERLMAEYIRIRFYAVYAELGLYCCIGWFAGQGLGKKIMLQQLVLTVTNTVMSLTLVYAFHCGYAGIAWGTVMANYLALSVGIVMIVDNLGGMEKIRKCFTFKSIFNKPAFLQLFQLNRDIFIRTILLAFTFSWLQRLSSQLSDDILAANTILMGLLTLSAYALDGVAVAAESLTGAAISERNKIQLRHIIKHTMFTGAILALLICLLYKLIIDRYIGMMTNHQNIYHIAYQYRYWAVLLPIAGIWGYLLDGYYFGATRADKLRNSMLYVVGITFPSSILLTHLFHNHGIWLSLYGFLLLRAAFLLPRLSERLVADAA